MASRPGACTARLHDRSLTEALDVLHHRWGVAVPFRRGTDALARENGVRVSFEEYPRNVAPGHPRAPRA